MQKQAIGSMPVNEEQFEVFHEVDALYNERGGPKGGEKGPPHIRR
jgi:hypothetical protein